MLQSTTLSMNDLNVHDSTPQVRGQERRYLCPLCGDGKPYDNAHRCLCVNTSTGLWNCKRCHSSGKLCEYRQPATGSTFSEHFTSPTQFSPRARARRELQRRFALSTPSPAEPQDLDQEKVSSFDWESAWHRAAPLPTTESLAAGTVPAFVAEGARYVVGRSISLDTARLAEVRVSPNWAGGPAVLFPLRDRAGRLVAVQGRYLRPSKNIKTRTFGAAKNGVFTTSYLCRVWDKQSGLPPHRHAWQMPVLILCEGPFDALALAESGHAAVALCGTVLPDWIHHRAAFKRVLLGADADETGDKGAVSWREVLSPFAVSCERLRPPSQKDWNEELQVLGIHALDDWLSFRVLLDPKQQKRAQEDYDRLK